MRLSTPTAQIAFLLSAIPSAPLPFDMLLPTPFQQQQSVEEAGTCEYYGYVDDGGVYNEYTIEMIGLDNNDDSLSSSSSSSSSSAAAAGGCAAAHVPSYIQTQCKTALVGFACAEGFEDSNDNNSSSSSSNSINKNNKKAQGGGTQISFRINKATVAQPDCVTEALRLASLAGHNEQTIQCFCLAECWPAQGSNNNNNITARSWLDPA
jgi:hypothetical protein